jgi:hypothetical protein
LAFEAFLQRAQHVRQGLWGQLARSTRTSRQRSQSNLFAGCHSRLLLPLKYTLSTFVRQPLAD